MIKSKIYILIYFIVSYLAILNGYLYAQLVTFDSTRITGYVVSENDSDFVIGSKVEILDRHLDACSGINGMFSFSQLPPGSYTIRVSSIGYDTIVIHNIVIPRIGQPLIIMLRLHEYDFCRDAVIQARDDLANGKVFLRSSGLKGNILPALKKQLDQIDEKYGIRRYDVGCSGNCI